MTPQEFQSTLSPKLKETLETAWGKEFWVVINSLKPAIPEAFPNESSMIRSYAKSEGYETCLRHIVALTMLPPVTAAQPEANYGVPELVKKTE